MKKLSNILFLKLMLVVLITSLFVSAILYLYFHDLASKKQNIVSHKLVNHLIQTSEHRIIHNDFKSILVDIWSVGDFEKVAILDSNCKIIESSHLNWNPGAVCEQKEIFTFNNKIFDKFYVYWEKPLEFTIGPLKIISFTIGILFLFVLGYFYLWHFILNEFVRLKTSILDIINGKKIECNNIPYETQKIIFEVRKEKDQKDQLTKKNSELSKNSAIYQYARQLSHDLRSPLEGLKSITANLEGLDADIIRLIHSSTHRISQIASDLINQNCTDITIKSKVDLNILLQELIDNKFYDKKTLITFNSTKNPYILGNELELFRAIGNIINNAIEALDKDHSQIVISLQEDTCFLDLVIQDNGMGIKADNLEKIMSGGFSTKPNGHGIGLKSSIEIFHQHTAKFNIESIVNLGSQVKISFPIWTKTDSLDAKEDQYVLIDNDKLVRQTWELLAKNQGMQLSAFSSIDDFFMNNSTIHHQSKIFVDCELDNGVRGDIESKRIYEKGYKNITLTTGYESKDINIPPWVKGVIGKNFSSAINQFSEMN